MNPDSLMKLRWAEIKALRENADVPDGDMAPGIFTATALDMFSGQGVHFTRKDLLAKRFNNTPVTVFKDISSFSWHLNNSMTA